MDGERKKSALNKLQHAGLGQNTRVATPLLDGNRNVFPIDTFARPIHSVSQPLLFRMKFLPTQSSIELNLSSTSAPQILVKCAHFNVQIQRA